MQTYLTQRRLEHIACSIAISWLSFTAIRQTTQFEEHLIAEGYRWDVAQSMRGFQG